MQPGPAPPSLSEADIDAVLQSDDFRMYGYKILPCSRRYAHDWTSCPFYHPGEKAQRRCPRAFPYVAIPCPDLKKTGACIRGDACSFSHNVFEQWLHPTRYRTQLCSYGTNCRRSLCFFAHTSGEVRMPTCAPVAVPGGADLSLGGRLVMNAAAMSRMPMGMHHPHHHHHPQQHMPMMAMMPQGSMMPAGMMMQQQQQAGGPIDMASGMPVQYMMAPPQDAAPGGAAAPPSNAGQPPGMASSAPPAAAPLPDQAAKLGKPPNMDELFQSLIMSQAQDGQQPPQQQGGGSNYPHPHGGAPMMRGDGAMHGRGHGHGQQPVMDVSGQGYGGQGLEMQGYGHPGSKGGANSGAGQGGAPQQQMRYAMHHPGGGNGVAPQLLGAPGGGGMMGNGMALHQLQSNGGGGNGNDAGLQQLTAGMQGLGF